MNGGPRQIVRRVVRDVMSAGERSGQLRLPDAQKATLEKSVLDAFEAGRVHEGVAAFLAGAKDARGERALRRLMDSALLTLGVTVQSARASWHRELTELSRSLEKSGAAGLSPRESPVRDAFRGIAAPLDPTTTRVLRRLALSKARFDVSLNQAKEAKDPVSALQQLRASVNLKTLPDQSLMSLIEAFADLEAFSEVVRVFEAAPPSFQNYAATRREYALALHLEGRNDDARAVLLDLVRHQEADPVVSGLLGKLYKDQADGLLAKGDELNARPLLVRAAASYARGFALDRTQLYPGVNLPGLYYALGLDDDAKAHAQTLLTLARVRASYGERDFFDASGAMEMCAVLGQWGEARAWLTRALETRSEPWQRRSAAQNLERLHSSMERRGVATAELRGLIDALRAVEGSVTGAPPPLPETEAERSMLALQRVTYRFGARHARRLTGNYQLAGIAHDVRVTPADLEFFTRIVKERDLQKITSPKAVSEAIDVLVRARFHTDEMEDRDSPRHQSYDKLMPGIASFMGAKENSQTNVSADWLNGLADCRQHAPVKTLLFEAWKRLRTHELTGALIEAHRRGQGPKARDSERALFELARHELRIMDAMVVDRASRELVEEHTLTLLSKRRPPDERGEMRALESLQLADSFYHRVHALAGVEVEVARPLSGPGLSIQVPEASADGRHVDLLPAAYSRDRSTPSADFGQLEFRGIQVASPGWEREVPTEGLDLSELHQHVERLDPSSR